MRSSHKAGELRQEASLERVLEHPHGQDVLAACDGDAEHAARILDSIERQPGGRHRIRDAGEVISLPTAPILNFADVFDEEEETVDVALSSWTWRSIATFAGVGLVLWAILAAVVFGILELVGWLR